MKIDWHEFMSTTQEWHAFVIGFFEVLCPWPPAYHDRLHWPDSVAAEHPYYLFGRGMGVIAWIIIAKIIQVAFF